jgi:hypothetical protein
VLLVTAQHRRHRRHRLVEVAMLDVPRSGGVIVQPGITVEGGLAAAVERVATHAHPRLANLPVACPAAVRAARAGEEVVGTAVTALGWPCDLG